MYIEILDRKTNIRLIILSTQHPSIIFRLFVSDKGFPCANPEPFKHLHILLNPPGRHSIRFAYHLCLSDLQHSSTRNNPSAAAHTYPYLNAIYLSSHMPSHLKLNSVFRNTGSTQKSPGQKLHNREHLLSIHRHGIFRLAPLDILHIYEPTP